MKNEMDQLADLGAALGPTDLPWDRLHARASQATTATIATARATRSWWATPALVTASVAALATAAVLIPGVVGTDGAGHQSRTAPESASGAVVAKPVSFTVVKNADGSVTFTVHDLLDLPGATRALNDAGIAGRVLTSTEDCTTGPNVVPIDPADLYPPNTAHRLGDMTGSDTVTVSSSDYPPGGGLLLNVDGGYERDGTLRLLVDYLAYVDASKIPQCVNFVDPGTGT